LPSVRAPHYAPQRLIESYRRNELPVSAGREVQCIMNGSVDYEQTDRRALICTNPRFGAQMRANQKSPVIETHSRDLFTRRAARGGVQRMQLHHANSQASDGARKQTKQHQHRYALQK
jgi:hypothetical protein